MSTASPAPARRRLSGLLLAFALLVGGVVGPAIVAPRHTTRAEAAVHSTCTLSTCAAGRTARTGWSQLGWPTTRGWYAWPFGQDNFTGGVFTNREGQLPATGSYHEYDVNPRREGAARDASRIVVDLGTGAIWFTPDHYLNFYRL